MIAFAVTMIFRADVDAQGGAYATGVLVLMTSAAIAVTLSARRRRRQVAGYLVIALVFVYTTIQNIHERPEGIKIASFFILTIILASLFSRVYGARLNCASNRSSSTIRRVSSSKTLQRERSGSSPIVATRAIFSSIEMKEREKRHSNHIPPSEPILFFEVTPGDASEFSGKLQICGETMGDYRVLRSESAAVPNAIAAFLLYLRNEMGKLPHVYFGWSEGNPISYLLKYIAFGEGDTAPVTHEVLRKAEKIPTGDLSCMLEAKF